MSDFGPISRRLFVRLAGLAVLATPLAGRDGRLARRPGASADGDGPLAGTHGESAGPYGLLRRLVGEGSPDAAAAWRAVIPAPRSARVLGERYLAAVPEERDVVLLMRTLEAAVGETDSGFPGATGSGRRVELLDSARLRQSLKQRIRRDFQHDDIVQLDGWVLARTECRLCALAVLLG
jgi:hypothetical protein